MLSDGLHPTADIHEIHRGPSFIERPLSPEDIRTTLNHIDRETLDSLETIRVTPEAPWDEPGNLLLRSWLASSKQQASTHRTRGFKLKRFYKLIGISAILSAALVFLVSNIQGSGSSPQNIFLAVASFVNLIIANLASFLDYGPKYQRQFEFEGRYTKLMVDIEEILSTASDFRAPKDRVLGEYKEKIGNLYRNAPEV